MKPNNEVKERVTVDNLHPAIARPRKIVFPVMFDTKTLPKERYATASMKPEVKERTPTRTVAYVLLSLVPVLPLPPLHLSSDGLHPLVPLDVRTVISSSCAAALSYLTGA